MPKFDYRDPAQDASYCDGLGRYTGNDYERCAWCNDVLPLLPYGEVSAENHWPYCSSLCATRAAADSEGSEV